MNNQNMELDAKILELQRELKTKEKTIEYLDYDLKKCRDENKKLKKEKEKEIINEIDIYGEEGYQIVEEYCDLNINNTKPYEEHCNGDVIIFSKWSIGDEIMYDISKSIDNVTVVGFYELEDAIQKWTDNLAYEILEQTIENADNNEVIMIHGKKSC